MTYPGEPKRVVIADIQMKFGSMVIFIIKWALASIPALIILMIVFAIVSGMLGAMLGDFLLW